MPESVVPGREEREKKKKGEKKEEEMLSHGAYDNKERRMLVIPSKAYLEHVKVETLHLYK